MSDADPWADVELRPLRIVERNDLLAMSVTGAREARLSLPAASWLCERTDGPVVRVRIQWDVNTGEVSLLPSATDGFMVRHRRGDTLPRMLWLVRLIRLRLVKRGDVIRLRPTTDALGRERLLLAGVKRPLR